MIEVKYDRPTPIMHVRLGSGMERLGEAWLTVGYQPPRRIPSKNTLTRRSTFAVQPGLS